jgi:hypothetical protein
MERCYAIVTLHKKTFHYITLPAAMDARGTIVESTDPSTVLFGDRYLHVRDLAFTFEEGARLGSLSNNPGPWRLAVAEEQRILARTHGYASF